MNEFYNDPIEKTIQETAEGVQPNVMFKAELEEKLRKAHKPRKRISFSFHGFVPAVTSLAVLGALTFFMIWLFRSLDLQHTPGDDFACPVTQPNGSLPPGETVNSIYYHGNGELWTSLWRDGKVYMEAHNQEADGSFSMKWGFVRGVTGPLTVEGHRIDADAEPLRAEIPDGYGDTGFQVTGLIFPTTGCWEVTARVGESSLTFVTEVVFDEKMPAPEQSTPEPQEESQQEAGYTWNGTPLYLNAAMPDQSVEMSIYLARDEVRATVDDVRVLAERFQMNGEIYEVPGELPETIDYLVIDGNRQLRVRSDRYYIYYPDYVEYVTSSTPQDHPNAESLVQEFLQSYGFDGDYHLEPANDFTFFALPITPDGYVIHHGNTLENGLMFRFNRSGIVSVNVSILGYDPITTAAIISPEEAFDRLIAAVPMYDPILKTTSVPNNYTTWVREQPLDETITYYGWLVSSKRSVTGGAPYISLNDYPVTGKTDGISENYPGAFIEAIGQFHEENGTRTFVMESWQEYPDSEEGYIGTIEAEGDTFTFTTQDGARLILTDLPADLVLPATDVYVTGVTQGETFNWRTIYNGPMSGGGGGGGGGGFFKLNLSGTPIPLPTLAPTSTPNPLSMAAFEGAQGILSINIFEKEDGSQRREYIFSLASTDYPGGATYFKLEGENLQELETYQNRPVKIWGTPRESTINDLPIIQVERYEIPYPELDFQLLTGVQSIGEIDGEPITFFTAEDGTKYVALYLDGTPGVSLVSNEVDQVVFEAIIIPGETYDEYPALRMYSYGPLVDPNTGEPIEYTVMANEINIMMDNSSLSENYTITVEKVDLIYYTPDQRYGDIGFVPEPPYIQPVWRFSGHYSNGVAFEFLLQALQDEYLLPTRTYEQP